MKKGQPTGFWKSILTKRFIEREYVTLRKSTLRIGREVGADPSTVERYAKKFGIVILKDALKKGRASISPTKFRRGMTPWNKGLTGIKCGPLGQTRPRGPLHFNWKGGKRDRDTIEYKTWRKAVYERDDYTCQHCDQRGGRLNAHHIKPWKKHKELRYSVKNGVTLCRACHKLVHVS